MRAKRIFFWLLRAAVVLPLTGQAGFSSTFQAGDVFYATNQGDTVEQYRPNGKSVATLTDSGTGVSAFLAFDSSGNLYVSQQGLVGRFNSSGNYLGAFATTAAGQWGGLAFNNAGDLFAGTANGSNTAGSGIFEFNKSGGLIKNYLSGTDADGVALEANQNILLFTNESSNVYSLNLTTGMKSVFATIAGGANAGLTVLPDGTVLVAGFTSNKVYRLDSGGNIIQTYSVSDPADVALDPDGTSFWVTNYFNSTGAVEEIDLATGLPQAGPFGVGTRAAGIAVYSGPAISTPTPEPTGLAFVGLGIAGLIVSRHRFARNRTRSNL